VDGENGFRASLFIENEGPTATDDDGFPGFDLLLEFTVPDSLLEYRFPGALKAVCLFSRIENIANVPADRFGGGQAVKGGEFFFPLKR
jgi:hypothetical protein